MSSSLLEILRSIPDHGRASGSIWRRCGSTRSWDGRRRQPYRQMHEFIRIHLQRLIPEAPLTDSRGD
jgi:hypothetical protein